MNEAEIVEMIRKLQAYVEDEISPLKMEIRKLRAVVKKLRSEVPRKS